MESVPNFGGPSQGGSDGESVIHARLLGRFALTDAAGRDLSPPGRKVRALLAYLILAEGRPAPRQELTSFAWADRGAEQARASLRQALHEARRTLPARPPLLIADRDRVRIDASRLETDVAAILAHARADRVDALAQALGAGPAPLLADLDGIDPRIDDWLAGERRRWAETLHAEVSACIGRAGPSADPRDIDQLTAFLAALAPPPAKARPPGDDARPRRRSMAAASRWPLAAAAAAAVAVIALALARQLGGAGADDILLVEPLQAAASDPPAQLVRAGLSGDLAGVLVGRPAGLKVAQAGDPHRGGGHAQLTLDGDAATIGGALRVHVQLADSRTHVILWSQNFTGPTAAADALREQVATKLGSVLDCALSTRHGGSAPLGDQAATLYLKACDLIGDYDLDGALDLLRQVTVQAPGFARAWADVAVTEALAANPAPSPQRAAAYAEADKAARRALRIDPRTGLAYYALAHTLPGIANWPRRVATIQQGLRVEPDGSELHNALGRELLQVGQSGEGLSELVRAKDLDPLNVVKTSTLIPELAAHGDLDGAEAVAAKARTLWPGSPLLWTALFQVEARAGDPRKALAMLQDPQRPMLKAEDEARRWAATLRARIQPTQANVDAAVAQWTRLAAAQPRQDPLASALTLSSLGRTDLAYRMLADSTAPADDGLDEQMFRSDAVAFRADPRFMPFATRRGLVAIWRSTGHWPDLCAARPTPPGCPAPPGGH